MMNTLVTPKDLNWVKERAACSLFKVFQSLQAGVEADVRDMQALVEPGIYLKFEFHCHTNQEFSVTRFDDPTLPTVGESIVFSLGRDKITVQTRISSGTREFFVATITLDNEGNCKLLVKDEAPLEQWQVRRMALEPLFFKVGP
jgi:hypothetical protein